MGCDMTVPCSDGLVNLRVGAIIMQGGKMLMVGNGKHDDMYSVGGRIQFGETAGEAVVREVAEETGCRLEIDRLGFVHENYFYGDMPWNERKLIYEVSFYFYMKAPEGFEPVCKSVIEDGTEEFLEWVPLDTSRTIYPTFFREELRHPEQTVKYFVTDERMG